MSINSQGVMDGTRPSTPSRPPYTAPTVLVSSLSHAGLYDGAAATTTLPLALHHIVPWESLWGFWNALVGAGYTDAARDYATLFGFAKASTAGWGTDMAAKRFVDPTNGGLEVAMCWRPWNLVRGPQWRPQADEEKKNGRPVKPAMDPGSDIDDMSHGAGKHAGHIKLMVEVGVVMKAFLPATTSETAVSKVIRSWTSLARHDLIEFDPKNWRVETKGDKYVPSVNHSDPVHPKWNKVTRHDG